MEFFPSTGLGKGFINRLEKHKKTLIVKNLANKLYLVKMKFLFLEDTIKKLRMQSNKWRNIFSNRL